MRNDGAKPQGGVPRSSSSGRNNGFFPTSIRNYLKIVSSSASSVASTVRSVSASVTSSISDRDGDISRDQVQWAGFDKLECEGDIVRQVLLLCYRSGFQVWDVEEANDVRELASRHDGPVSFLQMQKKPFVPKKSADKFADVRPLLVVAGDGTSSGGSCVQDGFSSPCNGNTNFCHELGNGNFVPTVVRFYSLKSHSYVHILKFRTAVYSIRCSSRVIAISQATQIHCLDAVTLEKEYTILTHPIILGSPGSGGIGYGPLAVGDRWLAYSGNPVAVSNTGRVSPQHLTRATTFSSSPSNGSLVAHYAKESSKQLAAGIVTLGDMGYKKLSRYCSELLPDGNISSRVGNSGWETNGVTNGHLPDVDDVGMVIVRDIVSKSVVAQFRAHRSHISALCFDPSGTLLVTASVQGHNINVFQIMPSPLGGFSECDPSGSYVHLYRLQRGLTNAVIQDISFSDDSQWIMISSSRGTSHLFALSSSGGTFPIGGPCFAYSSNGWSSYNNQSVRWPPNSASSKANNQNFCPVPPPVTLSVVSRIKNGSNGWRGTVTGAAAAATGRVSALPGAIASAFHYCKCNEMYSENASMRVKPHLLVFSPSGSIIQYILRLSSGLRSGADSSGLGTASYGSTHDDDVRLVVEAVQKWDVCQRKSRREREDNVDIYGEHGVGDIGKLFLKGNRKGTSVHPTNSGSITSSKQCVEEKHHLYISEVELQMHPARVSLWEKSEFYFHVMMMDDDKICHEDGKGGEVEIEKLRTRVVEARTKDLVPVFDHTQTPKFQQSRSGALVHQKSCFPEDGKTSRQRSCSTLDGVSDGGAAIEENGWGRLQFSPENGWGGLKTQLEYVNNIQSPEGLLEFVNRREHPKMETHYEVDDNILD
ncbi:autophagy-related protein 18f-like isoform X2 [Aristolochia californica]|uniref:autophagy-related protein 18f-like isoform X2 n=1 Tax=Aristolochia californica TaxID=171875 RepID=UPI0035DE8401